MRNSFKGMIYHIIPLILVYYQVSCTTTPNEEAPKGAQAALVLVESYPEETNLMEKDALPTAETWISMVKSAKKSIDIMQQYAYLVQNTPKMDEFLKELDNAGRRGVKIRILMGDHMIKRSKEIAGSIAQLGKITQTEVRVTSRWTAQKGILHAKLMTVDGKQSYLGSANLDWKALNHIKELGFLIRNPQMIQSLSTIFEDDWKNFDNPKAAQNIPPNLSTPISCSTSAEPCRAFLAVSPKSHGLKDENWELHYLLKYINGAKEQIDLTAYRYKSIYWATKKPFKEIDDALVAAMERGVKVRIMLDKKHRAKYFTRLINKGAQIKLVTIPEHSSGPISFARLIHAKYGIFDQEKIWMSTSNFSGGYFYHGRNLSIQVESFPFASKFTTIFDRYWNSTYSKNMSLHEAVGH